MEVDYYCESSNKNQTVMRKANLSHLFKHFTPESRVVMRADFNVPIKNKQIADPNRIISTLPTIKEIIEQKPKSLVLLSHHGRPNGQRVPKNSLRPVANALEEMLERKVHFLNDCIGDDVLSEVAKSDGDIYLCENVRYHHEEQGSIKDPEGKKIKSKPEQIQAFRAELSKLGNMFVNDAFGTAHRAHSSVVGIDHKFKVAGRLMEKQIEFLGSILHNKQKRVLAILGGSKVADKIPLIENLVKITKDIIIAGGMSFPFLQELYSHHLGSTKVHLPADPSKLRGIMDKAHKYGTKIHFPTDGVCSHTLSNIENTITCSTQFVEEGLQIYDIGPESLARFEEPISRADLIFWNGPVGVFQLEPFQHGSMQLLRKIVKRTREGAHSVIGGGDTGNLVKMANAGQWISYISTGGGASLEYIQGAKLPGIEALSEISDLQ